MIDKFKFVIITSSSHNKYSSIYRMVIRFTNNEFINLILFGISLMIIVHKLRL